MTEEEHQISKKFAHLKLDRASVILTMIDDIIQGFLPRLARPYSRRLLLQLLRSIIKKSDIWSREPPSGLLDRCVSVYHSYHETLLNPKIQIEGDLKRDLIRLAIDIKAFAKTAVNLSSQTKLSPPTLDAMCAIIQAVLPRDVKYSASFPSKHHVEVFISREDLVSDIDREINQALQFYHVRGSVSVSFVRSSILS